MNKKPDFSCVHFEMDRLVDNAILPGISISIQENQKTIEQYCTGWADIENQVSLETGHLFRGFSSTKIVTTCALLKLLDKGSIGVDDPVENFLPEFSHPLVLRKGAVTIEDTEPAVRSIRIRHLLTHTSGICHDFVASKSLIADAYLEAKVRDPSGTLSDMVKKLADVPLACNPGSEFNYGFSTDVVARVVEVVDGRSFGKYLQEEVFEPLGMSDTGYWVPQARKSELTRLYIASDPDHPNVPGLRPNDDDAFNKHLLHKPSLEMGGIGLNFSLNDKVKLLNALGPSSNHLLGKHSKKLLYENLLPDGLWFQFPGFIQSPGTGHSAAGAITVEPQSTEHPYTAGTTWWAGRAGTYWWISPKHRLSVVVMTHKLDAFLHPFGKNIMNLIYKTYAA